LGDLYAYYKGILHKEDRLAKWPFCASAKQHAEAQAFVQSHGAWSLILSKFQGFNRGLVPLEIGTLERPMLPFMGASAVSAVLWALALLLPAYVIGALIR